MPEPLLALEAVTLTAPEGRPVFRDLDWRLDRGGRFHVRAGSGGGCTALLRLCAGIAEPDRGRVVLDGVPLSPDLHHPFLARGALGWVPSDGGLTVNLTLLDNVVLPLRFVLGQGRAAAERTALELLEQAGLGPQARQRPAVPGDRVSWLVSLARAAAKGSRLWLVDRPAGGLDAASIRAAGDLLERAAQDPDVTLLMVGGDWMSRFGDELQVGNGSVGREP
ncbi:MAG: ATP-binding cassette domain-containing protein [Holophaga sp.]|jgi:ABC-type transporter Mla maintaining outer membrane lipid asymmetry ATPase subunit MlaF